jgi:Protein of unknown function (DUF1629)
MRVRGFLERIGLRQGAGIAIGNDRPAPHSGASESLGDKGDIFVIYPSFWGGGGFPRVEIVNDKQLRIPGTYRFEQPNGDPDQYPERPHLVHKPATGNRGGLIRDFESLFGQWIVSEALKRVLETVDPDGFAFTACDYTLADGSRGPQWYFCGVLRTLDALDEQASRLKIKVGDDWAKGKHYSLAGGACLIFKKDVIGSAHVFRTPYSSEIFCDRVLRNAIRAAKLKGVKMQDSTDY